MIVTRRTPLSRLLHALRWAAFILIAFILNLPILATIITSFKSAGDLRHRSQHSSLKRLTCRPRTTVYQRALRRHPDMGVGSDAPSALPS